MYRLNIGQVSVMIILGKNYRQGPVKYRLKYRLILTNI